MSDWVEAASITLKDGTVLVEKFEGARRLQPIVCLTGHGALLVAWEDQYWAGPMIIDVYQYADVAELRLVRPAR